MRDLKKIDVDDVVIYLDEQLEFVEDLKDNSEDVEEELMEQIEAELKRDIAKYTKFSEAINEEGTDEYLWVRDMKEMYLTTIGKMKGYECLCILPHNCTKYYNILYKTYQKSWSFFENEHQKNFVNKINKDISRCKDCEYDSVNKINEVSNAIFDELYDEYEKNNINKHQFTRMHDLLYQICYELKKVYEDVE